MLMLVRPVRAGTRRNLGQIRHEMICARRPHGMKNTHPTQLKNRGI